MCQRLQLSGGEGFGAGVFWEAQLREGGAGWGEGAGAGVFEGAGEGLAAVGEGVSDESRGVVEIREGLEAGDKVVVGNVGTLGVGMQVTIAGERTGG